MKTSRRTFLMSLATSLSAPTLLSAATRERRLPMAFSTLGCPRWEWKTILARADEWGYAAIELRGLQGQMDLTKRPEFSPNQLSASLKDLDALGLKISDLDRKS